MSELKPCPFCGSHNVKMFYDERQNYHVECYGCNKTVSFHIVKESSWREAVDIWNRRAQPTNEPLTLDEAAFISEARTLVPQLCDALEAAQRWISVKERLPDDVGSYLVYYHEWSNGDFLPKYDDYRIRVMRFVNNGKWCMPVCTDKRCEADTNREVTHWQPLPQPPQKGE